jgi:hypothetical protein
MACRPGNPAPARIVQKAIFQGIGQGSGVSFGKGKVFRERQSLDPNLDVPSGKVGGVFRGQHVRIRSRGVDIPAFLQQGCHGLLPGWDFLGLVEEEDAGLVFRLRQAVAREGPFRVEEWVIETLHVDGHHAAAIFPLALQAFTSQGEKTALSHAS